MSRLFVCSFVCCNYLIEGLLCEQLGDGHDSGVRASPRGQGRQEHGGQAFAAVTVHAVGVGSRMVLEQRAEASEGSLEGFGPLMMVRSVLWPMLRHVLSVGM